MNNHLFDFDYPCTTDEPLILQVAQEVRDLFPVTRGMCGRASSEIVEILENQGICVHCQFGLCLDLVSKTLCPHTWIEVGFQDSGEIRVLDVTMDQFGYDTEVAWGTYDDFPWLHPTP